MLCRKGEKYGQTLVESRISASDGQNPNIVVKGTKSYYSDAWSGSFEESVVRYHYGDEYSLAHWQPAWPIDRLYIGDYVCIGAESIILMGGNNTHRNDWFPTIRLWKRLSGVIGARATP